MLDQLRSYQRQLANLSSLYNVSLDREQMLRERLDQLGAAYALSSSQAQSLANLAHVAACTLEEEEGSDLWERAQDHVIRIYQPPPPQDDQAVEYDNAVSASATVTSFFLPDPSLHGPLGQMAPPSHENSARRGKKSKPGDGSIKEKEEEEKGDEEDTVGRDISLGQRSSSSASPVGSCPPAPLTAMPSTSQNQKPSLIRLIIKGDRSVQTPSSNNSSSTSSSTSKSQSPPSQKPGKVKGKKSSISFLSSSSSSSCSSQNSEASTANSPGIHAPKSSKVAKKTGGKVLGPQEQDVWKFGQEKRLLTAVNQLGENWPVVADFMGRGRTQEACQRKWIQLRREQFRQETLRSPPPRSARMQQALEQERKRLGLDEEEEEKEDKEKEIDQSSSSRKRAASLKEEEGEGGDEKNEVDPESLSESRARGVDSTGDSAGMRIKEEESMDEEMSSRKRIKLEPDFPIPPTKIPLPSKEEAGEGDKAEIGTGMLLIREEKPKSGTETLHPTTSPIPTPPTPLPSGQSTSSSFDHTD